jgi:ABC-type polysaccharide/polyol phosphate transport system ATPase subunit
MLQTLELAQRPVELLSRRHDDILRRLCNKAAWLDHGSLMVYGELESVLSAYRNPNTPAQQTATA